MRRLLRAVSMVEAGLFTVQVAALFVAWVVLDLVAWPLWKSAYELAVLTAILGAVWAGGWRAANTTGAAAWAAIAFRVAVMAVVFATQPGFMLTMLVLVAPTLLLVVGAAVRRSPAQ